MNRKGLFITFEGGEGAGKTTHLKLVAEKLRKMGRKVFVTREPGGTKASDAIRQVLLDKKSGDLNAVTETLLYMASRSEIVDKVIAPRLKKGEIVLCDRWVDSTIAYQGFGGGVGPEWILNLAKSVTRGVSPDRTIFLDIPVRDGLRRAAKRGAKDRMETKAVRFHEKVRFGYLWIAKKEPRRFKRIPVKLGGSVESEQKIIWKELSHVFGR